MGISPLQGSACEKGTSTQAVGLGFVRSPLWGLGQKAAAVDETTPLAAQMQKLQTAVGDRRYSQFRNRLLPLSMTHLKFQPGNGMTWELVLQPVS